MRVSILGPLEVVAGGEVSTIGGARLRALLVRLAIDVGRGTLGPAYNGDSKDDSMSRLVETLSGAETVLLLEQLRARRGRGGS